MFNQKGFSKIVLIIIVLILIGGAYFVFNKKDKNIPAQNTENKNSQSSQSIGRDLSMSDWKTYRNEKYGFEFKHPKDWLIEEKTGKELGFNYSTELSAEEKKIYEESLHIYLKNHPYEWQLAVYGKFTKDMSSSGKLINTKDESVIWVNNQSLYRDNILDDVPLGPGKLLQVCHLKEKLSVGSSGYNIGYDASCNSNIESGGKTYNIKYLFEDWEEYSGASDIRKGNKDKEVAEIMDIISGTFRFVK